MRAGQNGQVSETEAISTEELFDRTDDPFVRHQVDRESVERAWARGDAFVIQGGRHRSPFTQLGPVLTCLGPVDDLSPLMSDVDRALEVSPGRVTMEKSARDAAPTTWEYAHVRTWDWMWTHTRPTAVARHGVEEILDADQIDAVLDVANPDSFARPGRPGVQTWLGVRAGQRVNDGRGLVGVGALERMPDSTGHLRGVSVLPEVGGRGIGFAISHGLTCTPSSTAPVWPPSVSTPTTNQPWRSTAGSATRPRTGSTPARWSGRDRRASGPAPERLTRPGSSAGAGRSRRSRLRRRT